MKIIGLTGGIATGRLQAKMLADFGAVIDADVIARKIMEKVCLWEK